MSDRFFDTNVLLYLLSADEAKANRAEAELTGGGIISVQVLNEFAAVATRRLKMPLDDVRETLLVIRNVCTVVPLTEETHDLGMHIAQKNLLSIYDAMIVAAALQAGCKLLVSEDMHHSQIFEKTLKVHNPFR